MERVRNNLSFSRKILRQIRGCERVRIRLDVFIRKILASTHTERSFQRELLIPPPSPRKYITTNGPFYVEGFDYSETRFGDYGRRVLALLSLARQSVVAGKRRDCVEYF